MSISWFPGHMNKAKKELRRLIKNSDLIIEILDARAVGASRNPLLKTMGEPVPRIFILNKIDLADPIISREWQIHFKKTTTTQCLLNSLYNPISVDTLIASATSLIKQSSDTTKSLQLIIVGIPNVGKSSFLNSLCGKKIAKTGNEPAITRSPQRIKLNTNIYLVDTPGLLWPKLENQEAAHRLASLGTIRSTAIDVEEIACFAAEYLLSEQLEALQSRYSFSGEPTVQHLFDIIATATGGLSKGGHLNHHKASETLLNDLRSGKLGRFSLESPSHY